MRETGSPDSNQMMPPEDLRRHRRVRERETITSPGNQIVRLIRSLARKKGREESGLFVVEGERAVGDAIEAGVPPHAIVAREGFVAGSAAVDAALASDEPDIVRILDADLFDSLTDTVHPQGVLAILPIPIPQRLPETATLVVLLDGIRDPGNMGTLIRSSAAAGVDAVLVGDGSVDAYNPKVVRAAMGSHFRIPIIPAASIGPERYEAIAVRVIADAHGDVAYDEADWSEPLLLIVGSEADGPSPASLELANRLVSIPMAAGVESLNAAVAGSIILFEIARQRRSGSACAKK